MEVCCKNIQVFGWAENASLSVGDVEEVELDFSTVDYCKICRSVKTDINVNKILTQVKRKLFLNKFNISFDKLDDPIFWEYINLDKIKFETFIDIDSKYKIDLLTKTFSIYPAYEAFLDERDERLTKLEAGWCEACHLGICEDDNCQGITF